MNITDSFKFIIYGIGVFISVASGPMTKNPEIIAKVQTGSPRARLLGPCAYTKTNKTKEKQTHIYHTI